MSIYSSHYSSEKAEWGRRTSPIPAPMFFEIFFPFQPAAGTGVLPAKGKVGAVNAK